MCVCFSILMAYASKTVSGKVLACIFPIAAFVAMGFEHSVANMYLFTAATLLRCPGFKQTDLWGELFLCTAGNLLGAMFLALVYWYVNIHGTKLELPEVPHEVTTCCECGASTTTKSVATTGDDAARTTIPPPEQQQNPHSHHHHHQETGGYFTHSCANTSFSAAVAAAPTATPTNFDGRGSQQVQGEPLVMEPLVMSNNLPHTSGAGSTYGTEPFPK
ncbi:formate/nitrite transporter, putative [Bodo saltans]|uniref:Formate/nitrite transporter, putative n=1 Tax=Bodo saltans TaxID=75058 RepID=A0A0S4IJX4_BODSA|nr:formate/nitrite transporter, putative [Bodo saltans]|eukprot:CUE61594.1 formate/nitrite transporter, putative [Bodo saltans]